MKRNKQVKEKSIQQVTKLLDFKDLAECSEYFNNEYGKLKIVKEKLDSKKMYKKIKKLLDNSYYANLAHICSIDNKVLQQEKKDLKNAQCIPKQLLSNDTKLALQTQVNNTKLLTE